MKAVQESKEDGTVAYTCQTLPFLCGCCTELQGRNHQ